MTTMYSIDAEFAEDGSRTHLISIGIVAEDGRELYCEVKDFDDNLCNDWVKQNVLPHLWHRQKDLSEFNAWSNITGNKGGLLTRPEIAVLIKQFCDPAIYGAPVFYGYYAAYDWVVFCQIFGTMMDLPAGFPMYIRDIRYTLELEGLQDVKQPDTDLHVAIQDARWIMNTVKKYKVD